MIHLRRLQNFASSTRSCIRFYSSKAGSTAAELPIENATGNSAIRFFDSREKYLMFCSTTSEKWRVGERVITELAQLKPSPPSINIFDAGLGDAAVLSRVLRGTHGMFPSVPILAVAKEISLEDVRQSLTKMPDRFSEHPQLALAVTNMPYKSAPGLQPLSAARRGDMNWVEVMLTGTSAIDFERQIEDHIREIEDMGIWDVKHTAQGNPIPAKPSTILIYREDHRFSLDAVLPRRDKTMTSGYDLMIASQPFRSRASAEFKCKNVLMPMLANLKQSGRLVVVQSTGHDPGMEIVRGVWPQEEPFTTPAYVLQAELMRQLEDHQALQKGDFVFGDADQFRYELHSLPDDATESIGTSALLAAWNAATYVAQVENSRSDECVLNGEFQKCVTNVLQKYGRLWFTNEAFVVSRQPKNNLL